MEISVINVIIKTSWKILLISGLDHVEHLVQTVEGMPYLLYFL